MAPAGLLLEAANPDKSFPCPLEAGKVNPKPKVLRPWQSRLVLSLRHSGEGIIRDQLSVSGVALKGPANILIHLNYCNYCANLF